MPVPLIAADYLKEQPEKRPHVVAHEIVGKLRELLPKWMAERHGVVVYECGLMDSSSIGQLTFAPRMFEGTDDQWHPANPHPHMDSVAGASSMPIDWIRPMGSTENAILTNPIAEAIEARKAMPPDTRLLDQCFLFQKGDVMVHLFSEALYDGAYGDLPATKQSTHQMAQPELLLEQSFTGSIIEKGAIVGLASVDLSPYVDDHRGVWIARLFTTEGYRGKGYCRTAMAHLCEVADAYHVPLYISPNSYGPMSNEQLVAWWKRMGFKKVPKKNGLYCRMPATGVR